MQWPTCYLLGNGPTKRRPKFHGELTLRERDFLLQFHRNGRWGTCGACPQDADGHTYPEFCTETKRKDHNLSAEELVSHYKELLKG